MRAFDRLAEIATKKARARRRLTMERNALEDAVRALMYGPDSVKADQALNKAEFRLEEIRKELEQFNR